MKTIISKVRILFLAFFHESYRGKLNKTEVLVVRHDADCSYQYSKKAYSPIIDTIAEICASKGLCVQSIATPFSRIGGDKAFNSPVVLNRPFLIVALLTRILYIFKGRTKSKDWALSRKKDIWLKVLASVEPKIVIGIQPDIGLCRACKIMNIPVYDMQHGVIDSSHKWYGDVLPSLVSVTDLPTGFLCWDKQSASVLETWAPARGVTVSVVGHPWFQRFNNIDLNDKLVTDAVSNGRVFSDNKPVILVSLQWGLHLHYYAGTDFNKVMCKALESVIKRTQKQYNWMLRLHPVQLRGEEGDFCEQYLQREFGGSDAVEWYKTSRAPLPLILSQTDLHITDMSSVVIEASWFGLPSALLNPALNKGGSLETLYENERRSGIATILAQEVDAIESWIEEKVYAGRCSLTADIPRAGIQSLLDKAMVTNG